MGGSPAETEQSRVTNDPRWIQTLQPGESVSPESGNTTPLRKLVLQSGITGAGPVSYMHIVIVLKTKPQFLYMRTSTSEYSFLSEHRDT